MNWITRERPRVGRLGCAWLIKTFVDPQAEFYYASGKDILAEAQRLAATPYHSDGELVRQGDVSSFEVVMRHYDLGNDPALALLGQIVNTADIKQSPYARPEGAGLRAIADGLLLIHEDDHVVNAAGLQVYDALYAYCQDQVKRGRFA